MPIAYLIMAHKEPVQVGRLLRSIAAPGNRYLVHVDATAREGVRSAIAAQARDVPGVELLPSRACRWGGFSLVAVELDAMRRLLREPGWTHYVNLSGQDLPLVSQTSLEKQLRAAPARSWVDWFDPLDNGWGNPYHPVGTPEFADVRSRVEGVYVEVPRSRRIVRVPGLRRRLPDSVEWFGGSQWRVLARDVCRYLVEDPAARRLARFFRHTFVPDESFVQTALLNAPVHHDLVNDSRRHIRWSPTIHTFRREDYDELDRSDAWFARKFDPSVDPEIIRLVLDRLGAG